MLINASREEFAGVASKTEMAEVLRIRASSIAFLIASPVRIFSIRSKTSFSSRHSPASQFFTGRVFRIHFNKANGWQSY